MNLYFWTPEPLNCNVGTLEPPELYCWTPEPSELHCGTPEPPELNYIVGPLNCIVGTLEPLNCIFGPLNPLNCVVGPLNPLNRLNCMVFLLQSSTWLNYYIKAWFKSVNGIIP